MERAPESAETHPSALAVLPLAPLLALSSPLEPSAELLVICRSDPISDCYQLASAIRPRLALAHLPLAPPILTTTDLYAELLLETVMLPRLATELE